MNSLPDQTTMLNNTAYSLINSSVGGVSILRPGLKIFKRMLLQLVLKIALARTLELASCKPNGRRSDGLRLVLCGFGSKARVQSVASGG